MAAITYNQLKIVRVADLGQEEVVTVAHDPDRQGKVHYVNTAGKAVLADTTDLASVGATSTKGTIIGLISTKPRTSFAEESATLLRDADVWIGNDNENALDALDFGAPVFMGPGGVLDTAATAGAGVPVIQIGHVTPVWRDNDIVDKLLRINTIGYSVVGAVTVGS
jgi:phospholipase/lecithinase/hemolysin